MYEYRGKTFNGFGQAGLILAAAGGALAKVGVGVNTAIQSDKLLQSYQNKLNSIENAKEYITNVALRLAGVGQRIIDSQIARPGTAEFERALQSNLLDYMIYKGNCNADIFVPPGPTDVLGSRRPRQIYGTFTRTGAVSGGPPMETGPVWATACKNTQDQLSTYHIQLQKGRVRFEQAKTALIDVSGLALFIKYASGLFLVSLLLMSLKMQRKIIDVEEERGY